MSKPEKNDSPSQQRIQTSTSAGQILDWLLVNVKGVTRNDAKNFLRFGRVTINGKPAMRHDDAVAVGDQIGIAEKAKVIGKDSAILQKLPFEIIFEDEDLVAIDKPSGMLTIGTETEKQRTAHKIMGDWYRMKGEAEGRVYIVHRLDRETSGVLLLAKSEEIKRKLQEGWETVEKEYTAIVEGTPVPEEATLVHWLHEDPKGFKVYIVAESKKNFRAVTHYKVDASRHGRSRLSVRIDTGRKHQIRVQLAQIGHPVVGDERYGDGRSATRLGLHSTILKFPHPRTGRIITLRSPLPAELARLV